MEHDVLLKFLLTDADLFYNLHQLILYEHLFLLGHVHHNLLVLLVIVGGESLSSRSDEILFLNMKLSLSVKSAHLEDLKEIIKLDHA